jgi:hypothetical protein
MYFDTKNYLKNTLTTLPNILLLLVLQRQTSTHVILWSFKTMMRVALVLGM